MLNHNENGNGSKNETRIRRRVEIWGSSLDWWVRSGRWNDKSCRRMFNDDRQQQKRRVILLNYGKWLYFHFQGWVEKSKGVTFVGGDLSRRFTVAPIQIKITLHSGLVLISSKATLISLQVKEKWLFSILACSSFTILNTQSAYSRGKNDRIHNIAVLMNKRWRTRDV